MLSNWFKKVKIQVFADENVSSNQGTNKMSIANYDNLNTLKDEYLLIFSDDCNNYEEIRTFLHNMYNHFVKIQIFDLGMLRNTDQNNLLSIFHELLVSNSKFIILSNNKTVLDSYLKALEKRKNNSALYFTKIVSENNFIPNIPLDKTHYVGLQGHLNDMKTLYSLKNALRLGQIKSQIDIVEPFCRNQDIALIDLNVIKKADYREAPFCSPSGLTADDLTQVFRYLGFNENLRAIFIYNYHKKYDPNGSMAETIAQCIWYYSEALDQCMEEDINSIESVNEFIVSLDHIDDPLIFLKAKKSGRWWMKDYKNNMVPCHYNDYLRACRNEIPDKYLSENLQ